MKLLSSIDIVKSIVEAIQPTIQIKSWSYDAQELQFTIETCDTSYLTPCTDQTVTIDGNEFNIISVTKDQQIILKPTDQAVVDLTETSFQLYKPFFFHGSPIAVNNVLTDIQFDTEKIPAVYLWELQREKHFDKRSSAIPLEFDAKIFFLTSVEWSGWTPEKHKEDAIDPMKSLVEEFINAINRNRKEFVNLENFTTIDRANFGMYQKELGVMSNYFNDQMSGVELQINIKYKRFPCEESCL